MFEPLRLYCIYLTNLNKFTLSALHTKMNTFASSVDLDETAHNKPFHQDLQFTSPGPVVQN